MRILDLFSGAGGAGMGYHRAGFEVVGADINPQPRYPFEFHQADAFAFLAEHGHEFDAIHASPECRDHTALTSVAGTRGTAWQLARVIEMLDATGKPYVVENVESAKFEHNLILCADRHFGLRTVRHRKFRCVGFDVPQPFHPVGHSAPQAKLGRPVPDGELIQVIGNYSDAALAKEAMGIDWMNRSEMAQAIPPAYTEYIGQYLLKGLES